MSTRPTKYSLWVNGRQTAKTPGNSRAANRRPSLFTNNMTKTDRLSLGSICHLAEGTNLGNDVLMHISHSTCLIEVRWNWNSIYSRRDAKEQPCKDMGRHMNNLALIDCDASYWWLMAYCYAMRYPVVVQNVNICRMISWQLSPEACIQPWHWVPLNVTCQLKVSVV